MCNNHLYCGLCAVNIRIILDNGLVCTEQSPVWWKSSRNNQTASELRYYTVIFDCKYMFLQRWWDNRIKLPCTVLL